jgi:predicted ester cyclase
VAPGRDFGPLVLFEVLVERSHSGHKGLFREPKSYLAGYYFKALPDVHITVEFQVAEGDMVLTYVTVRGTRQGELLGVSATDKRIEVTRMSVDRI